MEAMCRLMAGKMSIPACMQVAAATSAEEEAACVHVFLTDHYY